MSLVAFQWMIPKSFTGMDFPGVFPGVFPERTPCPVCVAFGGQVAHAMWTLYIRDSCLISQGSMSLCRFNFTDGHVRCDAISEPQDVTPLAPPLAATGLFSAMIHGAGFNCYYIISCS